MLPLALPAASVLPPPLNAAERTAWSAAELEPTTRVSTTASTTSPAAPAASHAIRLRGSRGRSGGTPGCCGADSCAPPGTSDRHAAGVSHQGAELPVVSWPSGGRSSMGSVHISARAVTSGLILLSGFWASAVHIGVAFGDR